MGNPIKGTNVFGPVVPFNTDDIYASHKATYGHGGWRTVKDLNERNLIISDRREDLMIVAVEDNSYTNSTSGVAFYLLDINHSASTSTSLMDNNNWVLLNFGYGGDGWIFPPPPQSVYQGKKGQRSFDETYLYICVEDNLWKRVAIDWFIDNGTAGFSNGTSGLNFGDVPIWGTDGQWTFDLVVKNVDAIDSTAGNLLVTFTNNTTKILEIGGDRWILPPPMSSVWVGEEGDRSYDDHYFYVCIQDNLWKRVAYDFFIFGGSTSGGGGSFFSLPNGYVPIWDSANSKWIFNLVVSKTYVDNTSGTLNVVYTNGHSTSFEFGVFSSLDSLTDVTINNATSGDVLMYDSNTNTWINQLFPGIIWTLPAPLTSVSAGNQGDLSYDDDFIYVCIADNSWKRINIDYFVFTASTSGGFDLPAGSVPIWNGMSYDTFFAVKKIEPTIQSGMYGELITYTSGTSSFIPFGTTGILSDVDLGDLADVNVNVNSSSGVNNYLIWNGSNWINSPLVIPNATTSGNGLTSLGYDIELGGILSRDTVIEGTNFKFIYDVKEFIVNSGTNSVIFKINHIEKLRIDGNGVGINSQSNNNYFSYLKNDNLTNNRNYQFPDKSGTIALIDDIPSGATAGKGLTMTGERLDVNLSNYRTDEIRLHTTSGKIRLISDVDGMEITSKFGDINILSVADNNNVNIIAGSNGAVFLGGHANGVQRVEVATAQFIVTANNKVDIDSNQDIYIEASKRINTLSTDVNMIASYMDLKSGTAGLNLRSTNGSYTSNILINRDIVSTSSRHTTITSPSGTTTVSASGSSITMSNNIVTSFIGNYTVSGAGNISVGGGGTTTVGGGGITTISSGADVNLSSGTDINLSGGGNINIGPNGGDINVQTGGGNYIINAPNGGAKYSTDYSSSYTLRSLVDKEYVDNAVNGIEDGTTAGLGLYSTSGIINVKTGNGLRIRTWDDNSLMLGGTLIESIVYNANNFSINYDQCVGQFIELNSTGNTGYFNVANNNFTYQSNHNGATDNVLFAVTDSNLYYSRNIDSGDVTEQFSANGSLNYFFDDNTNNISIDFTATNSGITYNLVQSSGNFVNFYVQPGQLYWNATQSGNSATFQASISQLYYSGEQINLNTTTSTINFNSATDINLNATGDVNINGVNHTAILSGTVDISGDEIYLTSNGNSITINSSDELNLQANNNLNLSGAVITSVSNNLTFDDTSYQYTSVSGSDTSVLQVNPGGFQHNFTTATESSVLEIHGNMFGASVTNNGVTGYITLFEDNFDMTVSNGTFLENGSLNIQPNNFYLNAGASGQFTIAPNGLSLSYNNTTSNYGYLYMNDNGVYMSADGGGGNGGYINWDTATAQFNLFTANNFWITDSSTQTLISGRNFFINSTATGTVFSDSSNSSGGLKYDTDYSSHYTNRSLVDKEYVDNTIVTLTSNNFVQTVTQTRIGDGVNSQSEVSLLSSSSGNIGSKTLSANSLSVGDTVRMRVKGYMNVSVTGTFTFNIKLGATTLASRSSVVISHPKTNQLFDVDFEFTVRSIGASGKVLGNGTMLLSVGNVATPVVAEFVMTTASTINTTTSQALDFTVSWTSGFAGNLNTTSAYIKHEKI